MDRPCTLDQLKIDTLKCDNRYWERQHEKAPILITRTKPGTSSAASTSASLQSKTTVPRPPNGEKTDQPRKDLGNILNSDGKLTDTERNNIDPRDFASTVGKPPRNVGTTPNLLRPQDE